MALIFPEMNKADSVPAPSPVGKGFGIRSVGDLIQPGRYRRHSRFAHAVNYVDGDALVAVVDRTVGAGPVNIVVDDLADWEFGDLEIGTDAVHADGRDIPFRDAPRYDSSLRIPDKTDPAPFKANLATLRRHLTTRACPQSLVFLLGGSPANPVTGNFENTLRSRFIEAADLIKKGRSQDGAKLIKGLGRGLTPSGDDFIAGLLFALHLRGRIFGEPVEHEIESIRAVARSENPFSDTMLDCAARGRAFAKLKNLIQPLFGADPQTIEASTLDLLGIGATSGADLAVGLVLGLEQIH